MRSYVVVIMLLVLGCGGKKDDARSDKADKADKADKKSDVPSLCERACKKIVSCLGPDEGEEKDCVTNCTSGPKPQVAKLERIPDETCEEVLAELQASGTPDPDVEAPIQAPAGRPSGCRADCRGCVGDNSSCYMAAGGANGIPCNPCCCAPGGPSPTWKTPE